MDDPQFLNGFQLHNEAATNEKVKSSLPNQSTFILDSKSSLSLKWNLSQLQFCCERQLVDAFIVSRPKASMDFDRRADGFAGIPFYRAFRAFHSVFFVSFVLFVSFV
jgi:hypothetical protein